MFVERLSNQCYAAQTSRCENETGNLLPHLCCVICCFRRYLVRRLQGFWDVMQININNVGLPKPGIFRETL